MKKIIDFPDDDVDRAQIKIEMEISKGKRSDAETFSSVIRGLLRDWLKKS